jgi:hypothetical protein
VLRQFAVFFFLSLCFSTPAATQAPDLSLTSEQWLTDIDYMVAQLPERHANWSRHVEHGVFEDAVAALDKLTFSPDELKRIDAILQ